MFEHYVEAPSSLLPYYGARPWLFLAGGITGVEDWQADVRQELMRDSRGLERGGAILNPRRANFPINDPNAAAEQITWEFVALKEADIVMFWFPAKQIQPIALFELGRWSWAKPKLVVGADPDYPRRQDIEIQLKLIRPDLCVHETLKQTFYATMLEVCKLRGDLM